MGGHPGGADDRPPRTLRRVAPTLIAVFAVALAGSLAVRAASPDAGTGDRSSAEQNSAGGPTALAAVLSPDGTRVAVAADSPDGQVDQLYVLGADGSGLTLVVPGTTFYSSAPLTFSADGTQLLYVGYEGGIDRLAVLRIGTDGSGAARIADFEGSLPAFSPDGTRIAFGAAEEAGKEDIYLAAVDGSGRRAVTSLAGEESNPAFSPDGSLIAYEHRTGGGLPTVHLVKADGTGQRRLTPANAPASEPEFTPDGGRVVFTSGVDDSAAEYGAYAIDVSGKGTPQRYDDGRSRSDSRAGKRVYVEDGDVYLENSDGTGRKRLTTWQGN